MLEALRIAYVALPFAFAVLLALLLCVFVVAAFRSSRVGLLAVALLCGFDTLLPQAGPIDLGLKIYVPDIVTGLVGLVALLRLLLARRRAPILLAWHLFIVAVASSFVFGLGAFGTAAGGALRPYFYAIAVASYFMSFQLDAAALRSLLSGLSWVALFLVAVVFLRWIIVLLPVGDLLPAGGSYDPTGSSKLRTVSAEDAALIAQLFALGLFYPQLSGLFRFMRPLVPLFLVALVGLQHRSVWAALLAGLAARFVLPAAGRRGATQLAMLALMTLALAVPALLSGRLGGALQDVSQSAHRAVALADTAQVRLDSWKFAIGKWRDGGARAIAFGLPLGTPMDRYSVTSTQAIQRISFQAHNYYVQTLFNFGLLGLGASLFVHGWLLRQLYRWADDPEEGPMASALLLMLVVQLGFYITYGVHYTQGLVLGIALGYAMPLHLRARRAAAPTQPFPVSRSAPLEGWSA
ncbi:O-antigen ligase family protein [Aquabacterium sp.]|uniref:O-antigen ligase family protein n=1 Tax=Aquabacterium sp. TaxID=1872578 RepID=UPI003784D93F